MEAPTEHNESDKFFSPNSFPDSPIISDRRLSAAGRAANLRRSSLGTSPRLRLNTPQAVNPENARAPTFSPSPIATFAEIINPAGSFDPAPVAPTTAFSTPRPSATPPLVTSPDSGPRPCAPTPPPEDSPKVNRSGKKRRIPPAADVKNKKRMSKAPDNADPPSMEKLTQLILGLQQTLANTEASMAKKFEDAEAKASSHLDTKLDSLSSSLKSRLDKTESDLSALGKKVADTQCELQLLKERSDIDGIQRLVDKAVANRLGASTSSSGA